MTEVQDRNGVPTRRERMREREGKENGSFPENSRKRLKTARGCAGATSSGTSEPSRWRGGFIRSVHLENFMSHKNFTVEFGPSVTFLSGHNGSGKSATLQALQSCLGVKARQTGRGTSLANFVRRGCPSARVVVTLANEGEDAYKPEVYGSSISVEKRINKDGAGAFVLKNEAGKKVGQSKQELSRILDHLNLMVSNPCVVMTQDVSRTFLSDVDDQKRYKLFMAATMLDTVKQNLSGTSVTVNKMKDLLDAKEKEVNTTMHRLKEAKKKLDQARIMQKHREVESNCEILLVWSEVAVLEKKIEEVKVKVNEKAPRAISNAEEKLKAAQEKHSLAVSEEKKRIEAITRFNSSANNMKESIAEKKADLKKLYRSQVTQEKALESVHKQMQETEMQEKAIMHALQETSDCHISSTQAIQDEHNHKISSLKDSIASVVEREREVTESIRVLQNERENAKFDVASHEEAVQLRRREIAETQNSMKNLEQSRDLVDAERFGRGYNLLLKKIEMNASSFHELPVGPIGLYLELTDPQWSIAVEAAVGKILGNFILHDEHDMQVLRNCARSANIRVPPAFISSFKRAQVKVTGKQVPRRFCTVANVLRCTNQNYSHVIWNMLIDQARVEGTVLVDDFQIGKQAIYERAAHPASRGFLRDGTLLEVKGRTQIRRKVLNQWARPQLSTAEVNVEEAKDRCASKISEITREISAMQKQCAAVKRQLKKLDGEISDLNIRLQDVSGERVVLESELQQKCTEMEEALDEAGVGAVDGDDATRDLETQLANIRAEKLQYEKSSYSIKEQIGELKSAVEGLKTQIEAKEAEFSELYSVNEEYVSTAQQLGEEVLQAAGIVKSWQEKLDKFLSMAAKLEQDLKDKIPVYEEKLGAAVEICPQDELPNVCKITGEFFETEIDIYNESSVQQLEKHWKKLRADLKNKELETGALEMLEYDYARAQADFDRQEKMYLEILEPFQAIDNSLSERWSKFESIRKSVQKEISFEFGGYMGKRGHSGQIKFDNAKESLKMIVRMHAGNTRSGKINDMKSLSGGERSLSTLAFVLALGKQCESPFRASDEFDVFMDPVNRKVTLRTLLHFSVENHTTQTILLTPQDISAVDEIKEELEQYSQYYDGFIRLIRMPSVQQPAQNE